MPVEYPDAPPIAGWPAAHNSRLTALEGDRERLPRMVFAATLLGTSLPHYVSPDVLTRVRDLAAQYPEVSGLVGLLVVLTGAKIAPPTDQRWRALWEFWARWVAQTQWDRWGGKLKPLGTIVPEPPAPSRRSTDAAPKTPRDPGLYPLPMPGRGDPHHRSVDADSDTERTPRP